RAGDDAAECGLAGPVLADEGVDGATCDVERDAPKRLDAAEVLGDVQALQERRARYPGHSALNLEALAFVTTPPFGSPARTSIPPQPLPVLTALSAHSMPFLPSVAGRCTTVPNHAPDFTRARPTPP